jgi:hypothetical protein
VLGAAGERLLHFLLEAFLLFLCTFYENPPGALIDTLSERIFGFSECVGHFFYADRSADPV